MSGSARWSCGVALLLVACGGHSTSNGDGRSADEGGSTSGGAGGSNVEPRPTTGGEGPVASGGSAGAVSSGGAVSSSGAVSSGGSAECPSLPGECAASKSDVTVAGVSLRFPAAGSCGACTADCAECQPACTLPITAAARCTGTRYLLSVCASLEGQNPCLNTATDDPYYIDATGKVWSVTSFSADTPLDFKHVGMIDASLSLEVTDGFALKLIPVQIRACNTDELRFLPC